MHSATNPTIILTLCSQQGRRYYPRQSQIQVVWKAISHISFVIFRKQKRDGNISANEMKLILLPYT